jgi:hypothetical protein
MTFHAKQRFGASAGGCREIESPADSFLATTALAFAGSAATQTVRARFQSEREADSWAATCLAWQTPGDGGGADRPVTRPPTGATEQEEKP